MKTELSVLVCLVVLWLGLRMDAPGALIGLHVPHGGGPLLAAGALLR